MILPDFIHKKSLKDEYADALSWLESLGIDYRSTRFAKYEKDIELLENIALTDKSKNRNRNAELDSYDSVLEANDLIMIHKGLAKINDNELIEKLKLFAKDPIHSSDEKIPIDFPLARNTGLELLVAAHFALGGYQISFKTIADVVVIDNENVFHIECKRPSKESTIKNNLDKAYKQLKRRYNEFDGPLMDRGFVVLSIGKIINPENKMYGVKDESELLNTLNEVVINFLNDHKILWRRNLHEKTMAVFAYLQMAAKIENRCGTFIIRHFDGLYIRPNHLPDIKDLDLDRLYFREIISRLNEGTRKAFDDGR